ncbi:MAG: helicase HerA-like domain-containing protein [Candidatus Thorarchaeota archaeon]|jgi:DNA helicase HerA-like ATPase
MAKDKLWLGSYVDDDGNTTDKKFEISVDLLRRHGGVFGSTGSGKTVLSKVILEESAMKGIPILAFDPQGDIASLMIPGNPKQLREKGVPPDRLKEYMDKVIVRVYTPASSKGLSISINPLRLPDKKADPDDVIRLLDNSARTLVKVLAKVAGLSKSWESKSFAAIYELIRTVWEDKTRDISDLVELANLLTSDKETLGVDLEPYMKFTERQKLASAIRSLTVGSSQLLFKEEGQIDFDEMVKPVDGRTPINVIFLKTLRSEEEKHFFIAIVLNQLYSWMLRQGFTENPRMILFQDEAAPFIPAGMKAPGPKETFLLLFRQARKYGVECLIATQSPKDIDYKAFEQFNTIATGRISSEQSLKVLERILEPIAGEKESEQIIGQLPGQMTASFIFSSAEMKPKVNSIAVRWLLTRHITLTEKDVQKHMQELVKQQAKILQEMEKQRLAEEAKKKTEAEKRKQDRLKAEDEKKKEQERIRLDEEKRKKEEAARRLKEKELAAKKAQFKSAKDEEKVFDTRGQAGQVSYEDLINAFVARIEKVARTSFGLPFLKELVKRGELNYEKSLTYYLKETREAIKQGLASKYRKENKKGRKVEYIKFDFEVVLDKVVSSMGIREPDYVDERRLKQRFETLVRKAKKNSLIERIALGEPLLEFKVK